MKGNRWGFAVAVGNALLLGCSAEYQASMPETSDLGEASDFGLAEQSVAACAGDDLQYDFNAFAASLAVAVANELGRWDALADFEVRAGKLELSQTGLMRCSAACPNVTALLRLQDEESSIVPYHSPAIYRGKLTDWHGRQNVRLTEALTASTTLDEGVYRVVARHSGVSMSVNWGSRDENAVIQQHRTPYPGADEWRFILEGTKHKIINVRSGKCLALASDSSADNVAFLQKTCTTSDTQKFDFADTGDGHYVLRDKHGKAMAVRGASILNNAAVVHIPWNFTSTSQHWKFEPVGSGHTSLETVPNAMYMITADSSRKAVGVDTGSLADNVPITQRTYAATDDRFHWYISKVDDKYQLVNRRSGKCLALLYDSTVSPLVQKSCASDSTQLFTFRQIGDSHQIFASNGRLLEVGSTAMNDGAPIVQDVFTSFSWVPNEEFRLAPLLGGEPHKLTYSHATNDGPCGQYYWYDITQPNGLPLKNPASSFIQLIFAGGKELATGADANPFIAQQVNGTQVAIDPSGYMHGGSTGTTGSCVATDVLYDVTRTSIGKCCVKYDGAVGSFAQSTWSTTTYLCR